MPTRVQVFGTFRLDPSAGRLFEGDRDVALRRRTWDVLCYLLSRAGELVTKTELLEAVWQDAVVSDQTLSTSIAELRRALRDDARSPRFIETSHGRGFRFIAPVTFASDPAQEAEHFGRTGEVEELLRWWNEAEAGRRRVGFVTGEVGMGKTTLVEALIERLAGRHSQIAIGSCIEQHGQGEAFMPIIDAVRRLCRGAQGVNAAKQIRANAPPWLVELLGATREGGREAPGRRPATRVETLRCLAEAIEAIARDAPLLLVLEDMQWSDGSSADLLNLLGRRADPARLLTVATLRATDAMASDHPVLEVMRTLSRGDRCDTIELQGLGEAEAAELVARTLGGGAVPGDIAAAMVAHTGGNPFFLRETAAHLAGGGALTRVDGYWGLRHPEAVAALPSGILAALEPRIARLEEVEQRILEAAALIGPRFSPSVVSQVLEDTIDAETVDEWCSRLAARGEMVAHGEGESYRFLHALNEAALRRRIPALRRRNLHARIGRALECTGGEPPGRLATHFGRAGDVERALAYYEEALRVAKQRFAHREAALLCEGALAQLSHLPESRARLERELALQLELGAATLVTRGYSAPKQASTFGRVCELAVALEEPVVGFIGAGGLFFHHLSSGAVPAGRRQAERMLELARELPEAMADAARTAMGVALFNEGDLVGALSFLERDREETSLRELAQVELSVFRLAALAKTQAHLGRLVQARATIREAVAKGAGSGQPFDLANGHRMAAELYAILGEVARVDEQARSVIAIAEEQGFVQLLAIGRLFAGWAAAHTGEAAAGHQAIGAALAALEATGYRLTLSAFRLRQAEAALLADEIEAAAQAVEAGLAHVEVSGERRHASDLLRVQGKIRARRAAADAAEAAAESFREACEIAREQRAVLLELRALAEWAASTRCREASARLRQLLAESPDALPAEEREAVRDVLA